MHKPPKLPPIRVYREEIDDQHCAVLASCFKVGRRNMWSDDRRNYGPRPVLYGLSVFAIAPANQRALLQHIGEANLKAGLTANGRLPYIGPCEHVPGWGDFA